MNLPISERLKLMRESERITSRNEAVEIIEFLTMRFGVMRLGNQYQKAT